MDFTKEQIELLKKCVSYAKANHSDLEDAMDEDISSRELDELEEVLYRGGNS